MRQLLRVKLFCSTSLDGNLSRQPSPAIRPHSGHGSVWLGFLAAVALAFNATPARAQTAPAGLPTDGVFTRGQGTISQPSANAMDISQGSARAIIDWGTFSIGEGNQVHIDNAGGATLNRVNGGQLSQIHGMLSATGAVYLMNPQGVIVGPGGKVMTGGSFVASTRSIDADGFMAGGPAAVSGKSDGAIVNQGSIVSQNGSVVMIARSVSNSGTITAKQGGASMVAADEVLLTTTDGNADNIFVSVRSATGGDVSQTGRIEAAAVALKAAGGNVFALAGNRDGLVQATGTTTVNGELWLSAPEGKVAVAGQLAATNHDGSGGSVRVQGREVAIAATAHISAAGTSGGEVLVGASAFGTGTGLAEKTTIESGATILAGGQAGGGRIETSGLTMEIGEARIDAGRGGQWLLDPDDLTVDTALAASITSSLDAGTSVTQQTTAGGTGGVGDITVAAPIIWTGAGDLTLNAYRDLIVNQTISGGGNLQLIAGGNVGINAAVSSAALVSVANPGTLTIGGAGSLSAAGNVVIETGIFSNQGGAGAVSSTGANWFIASNDPANDSDGGLLPAYYQYDYDNVTAFPAPGNGRFYRIAPSVTISLGPVTKSYDGTPTALLNDTNTTVTGIINDDAWTLVGTYATKDAGTGINITASNFQATHNGIPVFGYATNAPVTAPVGTITPAILTASIVNNPTKTYNRTTSVSLSPANFQLAGVAAGETINVLGAATASYDSANAGNRTVNATFVAPDFTAGAGTLLSNYVLPTTATGAGLINPAALIINGVTANDKVYDSTTNATLNTGTASLFGVISGDTVTIDASAVTGAFATKNVGTAIPVAINGLVLSGADAANYTVSQPSDLNADITRATLVVSNITTADKIYDGTTTAIIDASNVVVTGLFPGDDVAGGGTAQVNFANKNVGNDIPINITGATLVGADAGNYDLSFTLPLDGNILPRPLTLDYLDTPSKVYDGTPNFTANRLFAVLVGVVSGESIVVSQAQNIQAASKNVGTWQITGTLTSADYQAGPATLLSNYILPTSVSVLGEITPAPLTIVIIGNPTKPYDGNDSATVGPGNFFVNGFVVGEGATVTETSGTYSSADAGVRTVTVNLDASDFDPNANTLMSNYFIPSPVYGPGTITRIPLGPGVIVVDVSGNPTKVYDGNTIATLTPADYTITGFLPGESAIVTETVGTYDLKDAGPRVVVVMLDPGDFQAGPNTNLDNYTLPDQATGVGLITQRPLTAQIIGNFTKIYNGTTRAALLPGNYQIDNVVAGESVTVGRNVIGAYDDADAGARTIFATFTADSNFEFGANTLRTNYILPTGAQGPGTILPAPLQVLNVSALDKVYDQNTIATLAGSATLFGVVTGDTVDLNGGSAAGTFATANVGSDIAVTVSGYSISGLDAGNYTLFQPIGLAADITPRGLVIANVAALDKLYDGTTVATLDLSGASLTGVLPGDNVTLSSGASAGTFAQKNVGVDIRVRVNGFALTGAQAGNYSLSQPSGLVADINPVTLLGAIVGNPTKTYDGTTHVSLTAANYSLTGFIAGEGGRITQSAGAAYDSPNAGPRTITATEVVSDIVADPGTLLSNYILPTTIFGQGTITQAMLIASIINNPTKVYDASTAATLTSNNFLLQGFVAGESATVTQTTGLYDTKNVGSRNVTATLGAGDFAAGAGTTMSNYMLPTSAAGAGTITPATVQVTNVFANDKTYDGTTVATLSSGAASLSGLFAGDIVNVVSSGATGTFATKNVGTDISVTAAGYAISGTDAANYVLLQPTGLFADITQATIAITSVTKVYDATTGVPTVSGAYTLAPVFGSDIVQVNASGITGSYDTKNVGTGKSVNLAGVALTGADAANYAIAPIVTNQPIGIITPATLTVIGAVALDKIYDQTRTAQLNNAGTGLSGLYAGDVVSLGMAATGLFDTANAGTNKPVTTTGYSISGQDAGNYILTQPQGLTATIFRRAINLTSVVKVYDGTTGLPVAPSAYTFDGVLSGDVVDANTITVTGAYASKDVGGSLSGGVVTGGINISVSGLTLGGPQGANYSVADVINLPIGVITPKQLTASIIGTPTKTYDALTAALLGPSNFQIDGFVLSEGATVTQTAGTYDSINSGSRIVTASLAPPDFTANSGTLLSNYILPNTASGAGLINQATLTISGVIALNKVYDGNTVAQLNSAGAVLNGIVPAEPLTITLNSSGATGQFAQANVGTAIPVTASGYAINGDINNNYILTQPTGLFADITQALLTLTRVTKIYDGGLTLPTVNSAYTLSGIVGSDDVAVNAGVITGGGYATPNVATGISMDISGLSLTGAASGNYSIASFVDDALIGEITPRQLSAAIIGNPTKTYNGNINAILNQSNYELSGFVIGQSATVTQIDGSYNSPNVVAANTVTANINGFIVAGSGTDLNNYILPTSASGAGTITPATLTAAIINNPTKVYDGTTAATLASSNYQLSGFFLTDGATVNQTAGIYDDPNAGPRTLTANLDAANYTANPGTLLSNYALPTTASGAGTITQAMLTAAIIGTPTKTYNGNTIALLDQTNYQFTGFVTGEGATVTQGFGTYNSPDVVTANTVTADINGFIVAGSGTNLNNYILPTTASGAGAITPAPLSVVIINDPTKVYDGNASATLASSNYQLSGFFLTDGATVNQTIGTYDSANAGPRTVIATLGATNFTANPGTLLSNYALPTTASGAGAIDPALLTAIIVNNPTRPYDGTTNATLTPGNFQISGFVSGEGANVIQTAGIYDGPNAGVHLVTASLAPTDFASTGSTLLSNYVLPVSASGAGTISQALLDIRVVGIPTKPYDGNDIATLTPANYEITGFVTGEGATVNQTTGFYASPDAGIHNIDVTLAASDYSANSGTLLSNYQLPVLASGPGLIERLLLSATIIGDPTKTYDGTDIATLTSANYQLSGFIPGQGATVTQTAGVYGSPNAGIHIITAGLGSDAFIANSGTSLLNYQLPAFATGPGTINRATLTAIIVGNPTKGFDGTDIATLTPANFLLNGFVGREGATVTQTVGTYDSANVGPRTVTAGLGLADFTANGGTLLSNYVLPTSATGGGTITAAALIVTLTGVTKVYDGNTNAILTTANYTVTGLAGGDSILITETFGTYGSPNAGTHLVTASLTAGDYSPIGNTDLSNYMLPDTAQGLGIITQAPLNAIIIGNPTKTYDGTDVATLTSANYQITGFVAGEGAIITQTAGTYASPNAGTRLVTAGLSAADFSATGSTLLSNYALPANAVGLGTIDRANLVAIIVGNPTRPYDGTDIATLTQDNYAITGFVAGQGATVTQTTGTYGGVNAGPQVVTASLGPNDFTGTGSTLLDNYNLPVSATGAGTISRAQLTASIINDPTKTYDATTAAILNGTNYQITGFAPGEGASISQTVGTYDSANAGSRTVNTPLGAGDFTATGGTLFSNYILPTSASGPGTINPALLMAIIVGNPTKVYDGTTGARLGPSNFQLTGFIGSEGASVTQTAGTYDSRNAGSRTVSASLGVGDYAANAGTLLSNYALPTTASGAGTINRATLTASITGNPTKYFDGTTDATLTPDMYTNQGFVSGEGAIITQAEGTYALSTPGVHTVTAELENGDFTAGAGTLLSNYVLPSSASGPGTILVFPELPDTVARTIGNPRFYIPFPVIDPIYLGKTNGFAGLPSIIVPWNAEGGSEITFESGSPVLNSTEQILLQGYRNTQGFLRIELPESVAFEVQQ